ncbi:MAG: CAP domain-containing protein, partial [Acidimicrobiales bacterium]
MRTTAGGNAIPTGATSAAARRHGRRARRLLLSGAALAALTMLGTAGPAAAAECNQAFLFLRYCNGGTAPAPAPTPTTTPTTAAPVLSLPPVTVPPVTAPPVVAAPPAPVSSVDAARRLLDLTNAERQRAGVGALTTRDDLTAIAVAHSERMAQAGDIFHSTSFMSAAVKSLLNAGVRGENVAYNGDVEAAHARLMASPGHRANILDARFSVAGFGVVRHADGRWFITENFIQPLGAARAAAPKPAAAPIAKPTRA